MYDASVRTTLTLDPDVHGLLERRVRDRGISFKQAVNDALRAGLSGDTEERGPYRTPTFRMGLMGPERLDKALQLAGELEDAELPRRMALRK